MDFVPAGEVIGLEHKVRTVEISESPQLPDGEYSFVDTYCTDPECDCRKTMIRVFHNGEFVSLINYGWEDPEYYRKWMTDSSFGDLLQMSGASIDIGSPDKVSQNGIMGLFHALLNEQWKKLFKRHYRLVKKRLAAS